MLKNIEHPTITLLGLAYKGNVDDTRESPSFKIRKIAESEGITVKLYDPIIRDFPGNHQTIHDAVKDTDCIVLVTDHEIFTHIEPKSLMVRNKNLIDTRNILNHHVWRDAGYHVKILGVGLI